MEHTTLIPPAEIEKQLNICRTVAELSAQWSERPLALTVLLKSIKNL